jgi:hypothetical protein
MSRTGQLTIITDQFKSPRMLTDHYRIVNVLGA